jgi:hypothetical protein
MLKRKIGGMLSPQRRASYIDLLSEGRTPYFDRHAYFQSKNINDHFYADHDLYSRDAYISSYKALRS